MAESANDRDRYAETIAILTVLLQIKNGDKGKIEEGHIAAAQNLLTKVGDVLDEDE